MVFTPILSLPPSANHAVQEA